MTRILYLVHDLDDAAVWRRVEMMSAAGAEIDVAGFRRGSGPLPRPATVLGMTRNGRMADRARAVLQQRLKMHPALTRLPRPDAIVARNLEMLALAAPLRRRMSEGGAHIPLTYEVLDIHRMMVGPGASARTLRWVERRLCRDLDLLIVSSPAFVENHFARHGQTSAPVALVENKVRTADHLTLRAHAAAQDTVTSGPVRIGWFGILRCAVSLDCLDQLTRAHPDRYRVFLRGRPALDVLPDFHSIVDTNPNLDFGGPYVYPDDLLDVYGAVDLAWLVDRYDAGANSDWLLPNRLYESGLVGVPPIGLAGTEVERRLRDLAIGLVVDSADAAATHRLLAEVTHDGIDALRTRQNALPLETWATTDAECREMVQRILGGADEVPLAEHEGPKENGVLIVVPTLQEAAHIGGVIDGLVPALRRLVAEGRIARLVISDGGSDDGTRDIVLDRAAEHGDLDIRLLDNPARVQSAGVNLACEKHGDGAGWLIRIDAHSLYPEDYVDILLDEARQTGAHSVVVAMRAVGHAPMQRAIAMTQNSRIGNGGSAHRSGSDEGRFVEHGHHALMRLDAFRAVGGYDETMPHNEDAELDLRLAQAGHRIWLTGRTGCDYLPRNSLAALMRQYVRFGRGRARTMLKHKVRPRLRQMAMIAVAPMVALVVLSPLHPVFALPAIVWALACLGGGVALAVDQRSALGLLGGPIAGLMHLAWSTGYWQQILRGAPAAGVSTKPSPVGTVPAGQVAVGLCTFRRKELVDTLRTLEAQDLPEGVELCILICDNDHSPSAQGVVESFAQDSRHKVVYCHAPAANISIARNAALDAARQRGLRTLVFIDDDELAPPHWISALLGRLAAGDADIVVGPVRAIYGPDAPAWMRERKMHDTLPELGEDGRPIAGHSCNVAMDLDHPALQDLRFDLSRGVSGGEDTAFFEALQRSGARLALAPDAQIDEPVPPGRANLRWLLKRRYRMGQTHGSLLSQGAGPARRAKTLAVTMAKVGYCGAAALLSLASAPARNASLVRGALHVGTVSALLGLRRIEIYGRAQQSGEISSPNQEGQSRG